VTSIAHVVRRFSATTDPHSEGRSIPRATSALHGDRAHPADLDVAKRRLERLELTSKKAKNKDGRAEPAGGQALPGALERETPIRELDLSDEI